MVTLNGLNLSRSGIVELPKSIVRLKKLQILNLSYTCNLLELPEDVGNLESLNRLNLRCSRIKSIPTSVGRLKKLTHLDLVCTKELECIPKEIGDLVSLKVLLLFGSKTTITEDTNPSLMQLVQQCRSLGHLGVSKGAGLPESKELGYTLACNRARSRTVLQSKEEQYGIPPKFWPLLLCNAPKAFAIYTVAGCCRPKTYDIPKSDAIYQLLLDNIEVLF